MSKEQPGIPSEVVQAEVKEVNKELISMFVEKMNEACSLVGWDIMIPHADDDKPVPYLLLGPGELLKHLDVTVDMEQDEWEILTLNVSKQALEKAEQRMKVELEAIAAEEKEKKEDGQT